MQSSTDQHPSDNMKAMIVEKLVEQRDRSEIVQAVCEQTGLDWPRAEELVQRVETEQAHAVARGQMPILVFLSAATAGGGLLLVGVTVHAIWVGILGLSMIAGGTIGMWKTMLRFFET